MKRVVSVSIGSSSRDHAVTLSLLGEEFSVSRRGTDGDIDKACALLRELDGQVDAIGLGGLDIYLRCGNKKYALRDGEMMMNLVRRTPVVDGSGLKDTLERRVIAEVARDGRVPLQGRKVLMVCAMDRFGMAESLLAIGANVVLGDLIFSLGLDKPLRSLHALSGYADQLLPDLSQLPISLIYPVGEKQAAIKPTALTTPYFQEAEIIAGDFHYVRRYLLDRMDGKTIITNTVTARDVEVLRQHGVEWLITTTPVLEGRSFGTNVMEALFLAILGKRWSEVVPADYLGLIDKLNFKPRITNLQNPA